MNFKKLILLTVFTVSLTLNATTYAADQVLPVSGMYTVAKDGMPFIQKLLTGEAFPLKDTNCLVSKLLLAPYNLSLAAMGAKIVNVYFSYQKIDSGIVVTVTPLHDAKEFLAMPNYIYPNASCELSN